MSWFVTFVLVFLIFAPRLQELALRWIDDANYSHGFVIPLISALLAWRWVRTAGLPLTGEPPLALAWVLVGCGLHLVAQVVWFPPIDYLALASMLYGLAVLAGGRAWARGLRFPIAFLFFMFPLPLALTEPVALWLQEVVSGLGTALLQFAMPAYREGNFIWLPEQRLEVGEACSGLRQMVAFVALALLIGELSSGSWGRRLALVVAAVPVAVAANLLRLVCMAFVAEYAGLAWIGGGYHDAWGVLTLAAGGVLLLGVRWWVFAVAQSDDATPTNPGSRPRMTVAPVAARPSISMLLGLGLTLVIQTLLRMHVESASPLAEVRLERPMAEFPRVLNGWKGQDLSPEALGYFNQADDRLNRLFVSQGGPFPGLRCQLWAVYFRDGRDRAHHPVLCHEVAGYTQVPAGRGTLMVEGESAPVERFCFSRNGESTYVFYWHYTLEPPAPTGQSLLQRIYQPRPVRWPSVTVEVFSNARDEGQLKAAAGFVRLAAGTVRQHLPAYARMGSDLLPVRLLRD